MKALVFAAGLGTRLKPITDKIPKALVPVNGKPMLQHVLEKLQSSGFDDIIINVHHQGEKIMQFVKDHENFGLRINFSDESGLLLDTGGGLKNTKWFFNDGNPFLIHNVDVLSDIELDKIYNKHLEDRPLATLVVQCRNTDRLLLFDKDWNLTGWKNALTGTVKNPAGRNSLHEMAFCGIHIIEPRIFDLIQREGVFSIIDVYLDLLADNFIRGYDAENKWWTDIGSPENLADAEKHFK